MLKWPLTINQTAVRDRKKSWVEQKRQKAKHDIICTLNTISQKMADFCCVSFDVWRCICCWSDQQNGTLIGIKAKLFPDEFVRNALCAESDACAAFPTAKPTSDFVFQMIFTSLIPLHVPPPSPMRPISALILWLQAHFTQPPVAKHGSGTAHWFTLCRDRAETSRQAVSDFIYLFIYFCLVWRKCAHFISSDGSAVNRTWLRMSRRVGQSSIRLLRSVSVKNTFRAKLQHVILLVIISSGP